MFWLWWAYICVVGFQETLHVYLRQVLSERRTREVVNFNPFTPVPPVKKVPVRVSPLPPLERLFLSPIVLIGFRRDRPIRIRLLRIYLEDLRGVLERSSFVISNFTFEFANSGRALEGENFQGSNFPFSRLSHSFLKIKMKR